jgi:magnesium-transporting ATPase (P-type)
VCFDKTGTLTEDGLDLWGVVPVANIKNSPRVLPPVTSIVSKKVRVLYCLFHFTVYVYRFQRAVNIATGYVYVAGAHKNRRPKNGTSLFVTEGNGYLPLSNHHRWNA